MSTHVPGINSVIPQVFLHQLMFVLAKLVTSRIRVKVRVNLSKCIDL